MLEPPRVHAVVTPGVRGGLGLAAAGRTGSASRRSAASAERRARAAPGRREAQSRRPRVAMAGVSVTGFGPSPIRFRLEPRERRACATRPASTSEAIPTPLPVRHHRRDEDAARPVDEPGVVARVRDPAGLVQERVRAAGDEAAELAPVGHVDEQVEQVARVRRGECAPVPGDQRPAPAGGEMDVGEQPGQVVRGRVLAAGERRLALDPDADRRQRRRARGGSRRPSRCRRSRARGAARRPARRRRRVDSISLAASLSDSISIRRRSESRYEPGAGLPTWLRSASTAIATFSVEAAGKRARAFQAPPRPVTRSST